MSKTDAILRSSSLFAEADPAFVERLSPACRVSSYRAGDVVFRQGEPARDILLVRKGLVRIARPGGTGEPVTLGIFGPREPIGLPAAIDRAPFPAEAIAACDGVEVLRVPAEPVLLAMETDNGLVRSMNRALLAHTRSLHAKIDVLTAGEVPARLGTLLEHLAERFGDEDEDGATFVPVALSRTDLARLVGARVETVIRVMSRWQKEGVVETSTDGFRIRDRGALARASA